MNVYDRIRTLLVELQSQSPRTTASKERTINLTPGAQRAEAFKIKQAERGRTYGGPGGRRSLIQYQRQQKHLPPGARAAQLRTFARRRTASI